VTRSCQRWFPAPGGGITPVSAEATTQSKLPREVAALLVWGCGQSLGPLAEAGAWQISSLSAQIR